MNLLFGSDFHTRSDVPICRLDDFLKVQEDTINQIYDIAEENSAKVIIAGDLFNKAKPDDAQYLETLLIKKMKEVDTSAIPGQHDLLYHKIENIDKGSYGVLMNSVLKNFKADVSIFGFFYGMDLKNLGNKNQYKIAVLHKYCAKKEIPFFIRDGITAKDLCEKYDYDLFIVGDNHHGFIYEHKTGQKVINCGCVTRQAADFIDYQPKVYLFDTDTKEIKTIDLLDNDPTVIDTSHLEEQKKRDDRITSFVEKLEGNVDIDLSFEQNLKVYIQKNKTSTKVEEKIWQAITLKK